MSPPITLNFIAKKVLSASLYHLLASSVIAKRLARGSFWSLINALVMKSATLLQAVLLAYILGISGFGEWGILLNTIATIGVFASFGLGVTTTKHVAQWHISKPEQLGHLLGLIQLTALGMGMIVCSILVLTADLFAKHLLAAPQLSDTLVIVGLIVLLNAVSAIYIGILNGLEQFKEVVVVNGFSTITGVGITILLTFMFGLGGAILGLAFTSLLTALVLFFRASVLLRQRNLVMRFKDCWREWGAIKNFALPTALTNLILMVAIFLAQIMLVQQPGGYEAMGAYHAANQWRVLVIFLPTQLLAAYLPVLSSLPMTHPVNLRHQQNRALGFMILFTLALSLPVVIMAPWLMQLFGAEFAVYWPLLVLVGLIPVFDIGHALLQQIAIAQDYVWTFLWSNLAMVIVVAIGLVWLIPQFLGLGLAVTLLLGYGFRLLVAYLIYFYRASTKMMI